MQTTDIYPEFRRGEATTGGRSVVIVTGGSAGDVLTLQADGTYLPEAAAGGASSPLTLIASTATETPITVQAAASQSANIQEWRDSTGVALAYVSSTAKMVVPQGTPGAASTSIQNANFREFGLSFHGNNKLSLTRNTTPVFEAGQSGASSYFTIPSGGFLSFSSSSSAHALGLGDACLCRNATGIIEINNGTSGTFRDLVVRNLRMSAPTIVPASASATGSEGQIAWDADYIYVCTATNIWKRVAIATW